ncbi:hypothetical protein FA15DRAFT_702921 [Coprinopsis marcescibilis]|uniref:Uncharacterized protein n=1 Tax=Coprinopsis marcescibilis TaxID=230819 RepID=A0A5C3L0W7_COPMA|nr:hypothetical protein FA15DRAFT_702921 [Coprinopsis marcescibilis]
MASGGLTEFPFNERIGMFIIFEASVFSGISSLVLILYKLVQFLKGSFRRGRPGDSSDNTQEPNACDSSLFLSLMLGELIRSVGSGMTLRWVLDGSIRRDTLCVAQGFLKLIGTNAIDFSTLGIAIQTFIILIVRWKAPKHFAKFLTASVWAVVVLITLIAQAVHPTDLMGPSGHWCWIPSKYRLEQIMAEYLWMWVIGLLTIVFYGLGYLVILGRISLGRRDPQFERRRAAANESQQDRELRQIANQLLAYPCVYLLCIMPQSFSRWFAFTGYTVPTGFTMLARTLFALSGLFNVILFFTTRYELVVGPSTEDSGTSTVPEPRTRNPSQQTSLSNPKNTGNGKHGKLPQIQEKDTNEHLHGPWGTGWTREQMDFNPHELGSHTTRFSTASGGSGSRATTSSGIPQATKARDWDSDCGQLPL